MKKRMKKALAEYRQVMNDISVGLETLAKLNAEISRSEQKVMALAEICDFDAVYEGVNIHKKIKNIESQIDSLTKNHNTLVDVVEELNQESHTHWWLG